MLLDIKNDLSSKGSFNRILGKNIIELLTFSVLAVKASLIHGASVVPHYG